MARQSQPESITPAWKVFAAIGCVAAVGLVSVYLRDRSAVAVVFGIVIFVVGGSLTVWSICRIFRENRGQRIPLRGAPPIQKRDMNLGSAVGIPMVIFGVLVVIKNIAGVVPWWAAVSVAVLVGACLGGATIIHNARLARERD